eukprot:Platyproteum_vivax@DN5821_c0_g1_i2.p1
MSISVLPAEVHRVDLDSLVVSKMVKHCRDGYPEVATGILLGVYRESGVLEVTHSVASFKADDSMPREEEDQYIQKHIFQLKDVNIDANQVGWYQTAWQGWFATENMVMTQFDYQKELDGSVALIYDPVQGLVGECPFKAFRLQARFFQLVKHDRVGVTNPDLLTMMANHNLDATDMLEEVPVRITASVLTQAFLTEWAPISKAVARAGDLEVLDLENNGYLQKNLAHLVDHAEDFIQEQQKLHQDNRHRKTKDNWRSPNSNPLELLIVSNQIALFSSRIDDAAQDGLRKVYLLSETTPVTHEKK